MTSALIEISFTISASIYAASQTHLEDVPRPYSDSEITLAKPGREQADTGQAFESRKFDHAA
jgi:hypothetical protein